MSSQSSRNNAPPRLTTALVIGAGLVAACVGTPAATVATPTLAPAIGSPSLTPHPVGSPSTSPTRPGTWSELRWSQPMAIPDDAALLDIVSWHDGYVAVGDVSGVDGHVGGVFVSADGVRWQRTFTFPTNPSVVPTATRLVAVVRRSGPPESVDAWTSLDGRTWQRETALTLEASFVSLAARDRTIVAVGIDANGKSAMWRSVDFAGWSQIQAPASRAIVRRVVAIRDGFLAIGRDGEPDVASGGVGVRGVGRPAAWWSGDGGAWSGVQVQGVEAVGAELDDVFHVADGYFAIGSDATAAPRAPLLWVSSDARDWRIVGPPAHWGRASANGQQAVIFAAADFRTMELGAWASQDGRDWSLLSFSGDVAEMPAFETTLGHSSRVDGVFAESKGLIVIGQRNGHIEAWFAEAVAR